MTKPDHDSSSRGNGEDLELLNDEEILALAEALELGAKGEAGIRDLPVNRGLELIRLAVQHPPQPEADADTRRSNWIDTPGDRPLPTPELPGSIGRFVVVREIGRGGFGIVLLATDPALNRSVALKVPRLQGLVSREARIRFEREARAVALLSHPGIVPLYETDLDGPIQYIAFGHVPGESLAALLEKRGRLPPQLAARIVARLADALGHAHQRGVVHRDLKPANILIEAGPDADDEADERLVESLKIADFGLAKFADPASAGITREGALLGTPSYMAPEQAAGREDLIGPASDIHGLGAILYELVTGRPPFQEESVVATMRAVEQRMPAPLRQFEPQTPRDLDAICLKCLEKTPGQRYAHAADLAADLNRWLAGEPVQARPVSAAGLVSRWCRRNPALAAALTLIFVSLAAGLAVALVQQRQLRNQIVLVKSEKTRANEQTERAQKSERETRDALEETRRQKEIAENQSAVSKAVRSFLYDDLLGQGDPLQQVSSLNRLRSMGIDEFKFAPNPSYNELLRRALPRLEPEQLEERFPGQPVVHDELLATVGEVLLRQGLNDEATGLLERARALRAAQLDPNDPVLLRTESLVAQAWTQLGRWDEATSLFQRVHDRRAALDPVSDDTLFGRRCLAEVMALRGKSNEAIAEYRAIVELARENFEPGSRPRSEAVNDLAVTLFNADRNDETIALLLEEFPDIESDLPSDDWRDHETRFNLGWALLKENEVARALPILESVVAARDEQLGQQHPDTLRSRLVFAQALQSSGKADEALTVFDQVRDDAGDLYGEHSTVAINATNNMAAIHWKRGQLEQSIPLFEQVCDLALEQFGPNHGSTLHYQANLAVNYRDAGRFDDAIPLLRAAADASAKFSHLEWTNKELFNACFRSGQLEEAEAWCHEWIRRIGEKEGVQPVVAFFDAHACLGKVLLERDQPAEAEVALRKALEANSSSARPLVDGYWPLVESRALLGLSLARQDRSADAVELLGPACAALEKEHARIPVSSRKFIGGLFEDYAALLEKTGDQAQADTWRATAEKWKQ